jgi:hypothetical protein
VISIRNRVQVASGSGFPPVAIVIATWTSLNASSALTESCGFQFSRVLARQNWTGFRRENSPSAASID